MSNMKFFVIIANSFEELTNFAKRSIIHFLQGSEHVSVFNS